MLKKVRRSMRQGLLNMAAMEALAKEKGIALDKSRMAEAYAHRLWEAFFSHVIEKVLNRP